MKLTILLSGMLLCNAGAFSQSMFSLNSQHPADTGRSEEHEQAIRFPSLRQAAVGIDFFGSSHYVSKLNGKDFVSGDARKARLNSFFTIPIAKWDGNAISATVYHTENFFDVRSANNQLAEPQVMTGSRSKGTLGLSLNFSRIDLLFNRPVIYSAIFTGISDNDNLSTVRRFNFNGAISFPIVHTADRYLSLGLLVAIDPSSPTPVVPLINYFQRLNNHGLQLAIDLPQGVSIRQALSRNSWIYFASNDRSYATFYKGSNVTALSDKYSYNTIELQTGPGFEYLIGKYVILGISGGLNNNLSGRGLLKGKSYNDPFIKTTYKSSAYGEFRISLLPF
jgi:hypothetical protein